jgi:hypothetical protein
MTVDRGEGVRDRVASPSFWFSGGTRMRRTLTTSTVLSLVLTLLTAAAAMADGGFGWRPT